MNDQLLEFIQKNRTNHEHITAHHDQEITVLALILAGILHQITATKPLQVSDVGILLNQLESSFPDAKETLDLIWQQYVELQEISNVQE